MAEQTGTEAGESTSVMIPCNGHNGTPSDMDKQNGCPETSQSEDLGLQFNAWIQETLSIGLVGKELHHVSPGLDSDAGNAPSSQNKATAGPVLATAACTSEMESGAVPSSAEPEQAEAGGLGAESASLLDESLEESSKILEEIPGIFTSFLDGGKTQERPLKKLRFVDSRAETESEEVVANGVEQSMESQLSSSLKADDTKDNVKDMDRPPSSTTQVETPRVVPELCVQSPDSEASGQDSVR
ncbi:uncharacterized protein LOC115807003 [Chanos chanos]|uniref:Uncharacterized protein LOC115807003 n=1 Tax=Chanos chanos TaxID=29144 RepID=A0A6J2UTB5_CHACN|nr:uncharacterized protein LOC115807003 [Chanos chanos]